MTDSGIDTDDAPEIETIDVEVEPPKPARFVVLVRRPDVPNFGERVLFRHGRVFELAPAAAKATIYPTREQAEAAIAELRARPGCDGLLCEIVEPDQIAPDMDRHPHLCVPPHHRS